MAKPKRAPKGLTNVPVEVTQKYPNVKFVSSGPIAYMLGVSTMELSRRVRDGIYPCVRDVEGRTWFDEVQMQRLIGDKRVADLRFAAEQKTSPVLSPALSRGVPKRDYSPQLASIVFAELKKGKTLDDIVIDSQIHPDQALSIYDAYSRVVGGLFFTPDMMRQLERFPIPGWPPKNADQFLQCIIHMIDRDLQKCAKCNQSYARFCAPCGATSSSDRGDKVVRGDKKNGAAQSADFSQTVEEEDKTV